MVEHPITLKEYVIPSFKTTRQDYINEKNRKFGGSSKFSFRKYKTDKERLEQYLREKAENQKYLDNLKQKEENNLKHENSNFNCTQKNYHSIQQPTMRYKPRTDLERIYYSVNEYSYGKISKEIVNEQLSKLHLNDLKKKEDEQPKENSLLEKFKDLNENVIEEMQTQKEFLNRQGYNEKNSETVKQIEAILSNYQQKASEANANSSRIVKKEDEKGISSSASKLALKNQINSKAAKKLMGEYNTKTFFKAASVFSFNLDEHMLGKDEKDKNGVLNKNKYLSNGSSSSNCSNNWKNFNSAASDKFSYGKFSNSNNNKSLNDNNNKKNFNNLNVNNNNNENFNLNTQASGSLSNRTKSNFYLTFNEMDEPYYDEYQESKQNNLSPKKKNSFHNFNTNLSKNQNEKNNFKDLENIQKQIMRSTKAAFAKTSTGNLFAPAESRNVKSLLKPTECNPNKMSNLIASVDLNNSFNNNNINNNIKNFERENYNFYLDEKYDSKSLLYLKQISAYNSLQSDNREDASKKENTQKKKSVKLNLNSHNASQSLVNNKPDGMSLRQLTHNELEDHRKYDEERITIDDETYLKSQFDLISKKVLKKCNYLHSKSEFNNKMLKSGQGKLMITSGLTINDFTKKFNVPK